VRLSHIKEIISKCLAGVTSSGIYSPTSNYEVGVPTYQHSMPIFESRYTQEGSGAGAVITVWGTMFINFDNPSPSMDMTVPVTNGNTFASISGTLKRQKTNETMNVRAAQYGATTTKVNLYGSGISGADQEYWDFKFTYTLT
jgi:hypothetical protein